mgnify:CR=1 FL=1
MKNKERLTLLLKDNKYTAINHITKKDWGFYLTDYCNKKLKKNGFKTAIVVSQLSKKNKIFIKIVHKNKLSSFKKYLSENHSFVLTWLDNWNL